jgi:hypothetical protein
MEFLHIISHSFRVYSHFIVFINKSGERFKIHFSIKFFIFFEFYSEFFRAFIDFFFDNGNNGNIIIFCKGYLFFNSSLLILIIVVNKGLNIIDKECLIKEYFSFNNSYSNRTNKGFIGKERVSNKRVIGFFISDFFYDIFMYFCK